MKEKIWVKDLDDVLEGDVLLCVCVFCVCVCVLCVCACACMCSVSVCQWLGLWGATLWERQSPPSSEAIPSISREGKMAATVAGPTLCNRTLAHVYTRCPVDWIKVGNLCVTVSIAVSLFCCLRRCLCRLQDKETYRWAIRETVRSMLAFGWTIDRTKDGDVCSLHTCARRISQSGQVNRLDAFARLQTKDLDWNGASHCGFTSPVYSSFMA